MGRVELEVELHVKTKSFRVGAGAIHWIKSFARWCYAECWKDESLIWTYHSSGNFIFLTGGWRFAQYQLWCICFTKQIWRGISPPKAELLVWFVIMGCSTQRIGLGDCSRINSGVFSAIIMKKALNTCFFTCNFCYESHIK